MNRNPDEISIEELRNAYKSQRKFREYVDAVVNHGISQEEQKNGGSRQEEHIDEGRMKEDNTNRGSRHKSIDEVLMNKTVRYYYLSLLPGECNEEREEKEG